MSTSRRPESAGSEPTSRGGFSRCWPRTRGSSCTCASSTAPTAVTCWRRSSRRSAPRWPRRARDRRHVRERRSPAARSRGGNHVSPTSPLLPAACGGTSLFPHAPSTRSLGRGCPMSDKRVVRTEAAPAPFQGAPYSQAIAADGFVFVSGQLGLKPGDTAISGSIGEQTEQVFANLNAILDEAGSGLDRLVKTTVFLQNLDDFQAMNEVYAKHVGEQPPARATVEVAKLPSGALVEIEAIARI